MKRKKNRHSTWLRCASFVAAQLAKTESPSSHEDTKGFGCLLYTSPSPRDRTRSRMPSSA